MTNAIENIQDLADLVEEISIRRSDGFDDQFNNLVSLILTGEQLRDQLSEVECNSATLRAEADVELYEIVAGQVSIDVYWALREATEAASDEDFDDEHELEYLRRGIGVIRKERIEWAVRRLTR